MKRSDTTSLKALITLCLTTNSKELEHILKYPQLLLDRSGPGDTNILVSLRAFRAGLFSAIEVEKAFGTAHLRLSFANLLQDCLALLDRFHAFSDNPERTESNFVYRIRWAWSDSGKLKTLMQERYGHLPKNDFLRTGNVYETACRTGSYFPGRRQLRPLPFNDEEVCADDLKALICAPKISYSARNHLLPVHLHSAVRARIRKSWDSRSSIRTKDQGQYSTLLPQDLDLCHDF